MSVMRNADKNFLGADRREVFAGPDVVRYPDPSPLDGWWARVIAQRPPSR